MPVLTEPPSMGDVLKYEVNPNYTREVVTLLAGMPYPVGSVLGKITASGKYGVYDNAGSGGVETAAAILAEPVDATSSDVKGSAVVRLAKIAPGGLTWKSSLNAADKTAIHHL